MQFFKKNYLFFLFLLFLPLLNYRAGKNLRGVIWSDAEGYYVYLPAAFIIGDFHKVPEGSMNMRKTDKGEVMMKYTCGVALFEMPFFLIAKAYCDFKNIPKEEIYNKHYARSVALSGLFACFIGLYFLRKALRRYFTEKIVVITLLATLFGTNLLHYVTKEPGMSHVYSFLLFSFLAYLTPKVFENPSFKNFALLGGCLGWIVLIRPTGILAVLFPLLYGIYKWTDFENRVVFYLKNYPKVILAALVGFSFFFLQMLYWHEMTGSWMRYSYEGETFMYWNKPKILEVLFDVQNGLLLYSPIVLFSLFGLVLGWKQKRFHAPALTFLFVLATYIFASWWAWWFGGAFGHRCYVELYPLLAFPMAGMFEHVLEHQNKIYKGIFTTLAVVFVFLGCRFAFLYTSLGGPWDGQDWRWNWDKMVWILENLFVF
jgi:hypothetical protein